MIGSTLMRGSALVTALAATPLAFAQEPALMPEHWPFVGLMAGLGMLFVIGVVVVALAHDRAVRLREHRVRDREALHDHVILLLAPCPLSPVCAGERG